MENFQQALFTDLEDKQAFESARTYAYEYSDNIQERNVFPTQRALEDLTMFEEEMPNKGTAANSLIRQLHQFGSPATVMQTGGRYFGFVNGGAIPAGLAAKWLSDFWDQNSAMQVISPLCAKLEVVVEDWLKHIFNLPKSTVAGFVSGSFAASFCSISAARFRILQRKGWDVNEKGLFGAPPIRVVTSVQAHSTIHKAIGLAGLGKVNIEWVDVDDQGRIIPDLMPQLDENTIVILQAGNVNSGCYEDFETICAYANKAKAWVHIDGAFGLWAELVPSLKYLTRGMQLADSWAVDGHKTLNTPYDCGIILCKDKEALVSSLHMSGSYIMLGERDGMFYTTEMSRRSRIIELWAVMKNLGREGMEQMILHLHKRAVQFADELRNHDFQILNEVVFNQVLVYYRTDESTAVILEYIQKEGVCWCGGSIWQGKKVIRISVCSWATTSEDITRSVESFCKAKRREEITSQKR